MPTPRFIHTPLSQFRHTAQGVRVSQIYKNIQNTQTQITSTHFKILSTHNSEYTYSQIHKDKPNFQIQTQIHKHTSTDAIQIHTTPRPTDSYPTRQTDRHTFNTQIHR